MKKVGTYVTSSGNTYCWNWVNWQNSNYKNPMFLNKLYIIIVAQ